MKMKSLHRGTSRIARRLGVFGCLLVATGLAVWLREFTVALPLLVGATFMALAVLNALFETVMLADDTLLPPALRIQT